MLIPLRLVRDQHLQQQLFDQLRDLIVSHRLQPGSRMPSSRMMAEQFAISRMTVLLSYERLIAEGYLETRPAAGTFVAQSPVRPASEAATDASSLALVHRPANPHPGATSAPAQVCGGPSSAPSDVRLSGADPSLFPAQRWRSLIRRGLDRIGIGFEPEHPAGNPALRQAIADWLSTSRGLSASAEQVLLVKSRQQALHVAARLASHPCEGRRVLGCLGGEAMAPGPGWTGSADTVREEGSAAVYNGRRPTHHTRIVVEDPCGPDTDAALAGNGGELVRVPVDADGLCTEQLPRGAAALVHVTPEHQRMLGAVLSHGRRIALLRWAAEAGALILEEDIDGELRYGNMDAPSLMSLDRSERVMLLGGFGVSLGPWLDVAYLVLPRWLVPYAQTTRRWIDDSRGSIEHAVLAEYLASGGYARHLHRLTKAYAGRRDVLLTGLRRQFGEDTQVWGHQAGLHVAWFPPIDLAPAGDLATLARRFGLDAAPARDGVVLLGFGTTDEQHIEAAIRRLAETRMDKTRLAANETILPSANMPAGYLSVTANRARA